jgi:predicted O-methyltransferase YrrM
MNMAVDERTREWFHERYWADDAALLDARDAFAKIGPLIEVPSDTGAFLATMVRATGARRVIEVGTLFGYSAVWMARALPADGHLDTLELFDAHADAAEALLRECDLSQQVAVHRGSATESLATLTGPYDLAFVDADKVGYVGYVDQLIDLVRPGGTIIADNVAQNGRVADPMSDNESAVAMRAFHEHVRNHPRLITNVIPIGDGLAVSVVQP